MEFSVETFKALVCRIQERQRYYKDWIDVLKGTTEIDFAQYKQSVLDELDELAIIVGLPRAEDLK